jgi:hypothetical protein
LKKLKSISNNLNKIKLFNLRSLKKAERSDFIEQYILENKPTIAFIDNVRDILINFNDIEQSDKTLTMLATTAEKSNTHICCTIHLTKTNKTARGHIGSELCEKSETVFETKSDAGNDEVTVSAIFTRNKHFNDLYFNISGGHPEFNQML